MRNGDDQLGPGQTQLAAILEGITDVFFAVDYKWRLIYLNQTAEKFCSRAREQLIGQNLFEVIPYDLSLSFSRQLHIAMSKKIPLHMEKPLPPSGRWYEISVHPYEGGLSFYLQDINERKRNEDALRISEEKFYKVFRFSPQVIAVASLVEGRFIEVNDSFQRIFGYERDQTIGRTSLEMGIWIDFEERVNITRMLLQQGQVYNLETYLRDSSGRLRIGLVSAEVIDISGEKCVLFLFNDITERRQAEEALRLSEERFRHIFNTSQSIMAITTLKDNRYMDVNNSWLCFSGYSREEALGRTALDLGLYTDLNDYNRLEQLFLEQGKVDNMEVHFQNKSGKARVGLVSLNMINIGGELCILRVMTDITEYKRLEKEVNRLDRLNLVGEMAASIAHEIRNPMTTVRGFLQMFSGQEEFNEDREDFALMIGELDRANSIITEYLSLARDKAVNLKKRNLNNILRSLHPLILADAVMTDKVVTLELGIIPDLLLDQHEVSQIILNLTRNGLEATAPGGVVSVRTFTDGGEVVMSVQDRGTGIAPELLDKLGVPFFTTKEHGTGLGLSVCYGIAMRHNATINIETGPTGTTVFVRFRKMVKI